MAKRPTQVWRTFSTRPIRDDEDGCGWLIQVGDDPEDYIVAGYHHEHKKFLDGRTQFVIDKVIRFAKINM